MIRFIALIYGLLGFFLVACAVIPPPFFTALSPFERLIGGLVGVQAIGNAIQIAISD